MSQGQQYIKVWDPVIRIFHWTLVAAFFIAYISGDELLGLHVWAGYLIICLLIFRIVWGLVGSQHARFTDFIYPTATIREYLKNTLRLKAPRYLGHNPAGGIMVVVLLIMLILISVSGLVLYAVDEHAGPLASQLSGVDKSWDDFLEAVHEFFVDFTLILIAIHLGGVLVESLLHRENLIQAMITGLKKK
jgi:cytochrome b